MIFRFKIQLDDSSAVKITMDILIFVLGFLRLFTQLFMVSLMSSRQELLRIGLETYDDMKWVQKLIKFHYYRSLYLTILFETLKTVVSLSLLHDINDYLTVGVAGCVHFNLVITTVYILRYSILFSVMDIGRSRKRGIIENDDLVYKEQKKLWYILNFLPRYLPDETEVARIVKKNPDDFDAV
jgi:hypothetical protein